MISLLLSFLISLFHPTPVGQDVHGPAVWRACAPMDLFALEAPQTLLRRTPEMLESLEWISDLHVPRTALGMTPSQGAGDGWDHVRSMLTEGSAGDGSNATYPGSPF
jgi:hypothetical protein